MITVEHWACACHHDAIESFGNCTILLYYPAAVAACTPPCDSAIAIITCKIVDNCFVLLQVTGIAVSDRHPYMFSCGLDKMVKCWDMEYNKVQ